VTATAPQSNQRTAVIVGAVMVAVVLVIVLWLLTRGEPGYGQASPTPGASTSASQSAAASQTAPVVTPTGAAVTWGWELRELPGGPVRGAARIGDRWVALDGLEAWTSSDGAAWERATVDDTPQEADGQIVLGQVAALGDAYYSVGNWFGRGDAVHPVVWSSPDGTDWTQVAPSAPWGHLANDVASDGTQLAVAGGLFGSGGVWISADATTWTEHTSEGGPATMNAIHGDGEGFVAVGLRADTQGTSFPAIWHSADGESWTDAAVPPTDVSITLLDVTRLPGGRYLAIGIRGTDIDAGEFVAWYADDPSTWTDAGVITGGTVPGLLLATDTGVLAFTGAVDGPSVRFSVDGTTWEELRSLILPDVVARASAAATDGSTVILLGSTDEGDAHFVWVGRRGTE
jgi:hypothetical protein